MLPAVFEPFLKEAPLCVMAQVALENLFDPKRLDQLFIDTAQRQYHKELLFSDIIELMTSVVWRISPSVHAAFQKRKEGLPVSDQAIYDKLRSTETGISAALVADSAKQAIPVIDALGARQEPWVKNYRTRIIDGNHLSATEHRIKPLRLVWAAPLPGTVLAVHEPEVDLVTQVFLTPDGHEQERTLLADVLQSVQPKDLWIADRNFCTFDFLHGIAKAGAAFVIRQHGTMKGNLLGKRHYRGRAETGRVYAQRIKVNKHGRVLHMRRITLILDTPTKDGDTEIHILTNLPAQEVDAKRVAELYRRRWTIEGRFYEVTQTLNCEPNTLGYPQAALLAFCLALVGSNAVAMMKAALRVTHGEEKVSTLSTYFMALEIRQTYTGMMIALPSPAWSDLRGLSPAELASVLRAIAERVRLSRYPKSKRGPKKPAPPKDQYQNGGHVSTFRLLQNGK